MVGFLGFSSIQVANRLFPCGVALSGNPLQLVAASHHSSPNCTTKAYQRHGLIQFRCDMMSMCNTIGSYTKAAAREELQTYKRSALGGGSAGRASKPARRLLLCLCGSPWDPRNHQNAAVTWLGPLDTRQRQRRSRDRALPQSRASYQQGQLLGFQLGPFDAVFWVEQVQDLKKIGDRIQILSCSEATTWLALDNSSTTDSCWDMGTFLKRNKTLTHWIIFG